MNRLNILSHLFANSPRWRRVAVWSAILSTAAGATALAQPAPGPGGQQPDQVFAQAAASDAFIMNQTPSGSVADQGSYSRDIGIGGTGAMARMGHIIGETVGRKQSLTHFEVMPYAFVDNTMWYTDARFYTTNNGHIGGTGGVGVRQFLPNFNAVIGAGAFYDADDTRAKMFTQAGLSLEYLSEYLDVRSNLYANTGRKSAVLGTSFVAGSEHFVDDNIAFNTQTRRAAGTDGIDLTLTVPVPGEVAQSINLEASAGGYHFIANDFDLEDATGYRLRLDGDFLASAVHTFLEFTSDKAFNNNVIFGADLNYYHDIQRRPRIGHNQFNRMSEWVRRNYTVAAIEDTVINPDELAINPVTGLPYVVLHVRNITPADPDFPNFPAPAGDGSIDTPFQFIDEAQADPRNADIVFVHSGSVFNDMPVILEENQQILGEGVDHVIQVANPIANNGTILLPTATVPPNDPILPVLQNTLGTAVTLANGSVFAGFDIVNTTGTAILGDGINGSEIRDVNIEGTNGVNAHGVHFIDTTGNIRVEQVRTTGVEGTDLFVDGGSSTINWFGGLLDNTAGRAVVIQDQTGGTINLAGDNASGPAFGFGGLTITDNGGEGILVTNTNAATVFGRSADTPLTQHGVTLNNSSTTGVQITNLLQAGSVSFLHGLQVADAADIAIDIQNSAGDVFFLDDTNIADDVLILGRDENSAISLNAIGSLSQVVFLGDVTIGAVPPTAIDPVTDAPFLEDPAINFFNGSTGLVRFDGDINIGTVARTGESAASNGTTINIGDINGVLENGAGAQFIANGNIQIEGNRGGAGILVANDPTTVTFGTTAAPAQIRINPETDDDEEGQAIVLVNNSGPIRFNSSVTVGSSLNNQINVINNTGTITFSSVNVTDADVEFFTPIVNVDSNASVGFGSLSVTNQDSLSFRGYDNGSLTVNGGTIESDGGPAIDLVNNLSLNATFNSVSADDYDPFPFAIRVLDDQTVSTETGDIITNPNARFRILGGTAAGSGGLISSGATDDDGLAPRGAIFQNIDTVSLNGMEFDSNEGVAIFSLNTVNFNLSNSLLTDNGRGDIDDFITNDPEGFHQVVLRVDQDIEDVDSYDYTIQGNVMQDTEVVFTNDALLQIETSNSATGAELNLSIVDNRGDDTAAIPGIISRRFLLEGAAIRVDWAGPINAAIENNGFELADAVDNQIGVDIIQRGASFTNTVSFNENFLFATDSGADDVTGVRMDFAGATNLTILNNALVDSVDGSIDPGFIFAGEDATGFDLTLRSVGNSVTIDDNFLQFGNVGGTGILFRLINASNVRIGDDTGSFTDFGNRIELTDFDATLERGIIFQTTLGTVNLSGTQDNQIVGQPGTGTLVPFQAPGSSTGQIIINGTPSP